MIQHSSHSHRNRQSKKGIDQPIIAIGGVKIEDIKNLMKTGIYGVAIASAINASEDMEMSIQKILKEFEYGEFTHS